MNNLCSIKRIAFRIYTGKKNKNQASNLILPNQAESLFPQQSSCNLSVWLSYLHINLANISENKNPPRQSSIVPKHLPQNTLTVKYTTKTKYTCLAKILLPCTIRLRYLMPMNLLESEDL